MAKQELSGIICGMSPIAEVFLTAIAKESIMFAFGQLKSVLGRHKAALTVTLDQIEKALIEHQNEVANWTSEVSFKDFPAGRQTEDVFVPLDIYLHQLRTRSDGEVLPEIALEDALMSERRSHIILGQPGAGKTTALKHICHRFFHDFKFLSDFNFIIRIKLRDINASVSRESPEYLSRALQDLLGLQISYPQSLQGDDNSDARKAIRTRILVDWLNSTKVLLVLDGFDEITLKLRRDFILEELRLLSPQLTESSFILTARSGEFNFHIEGVSIFEIAPLSELQIETFAFRWLGEKDERVFIAQLKKTPFHDTAIRPLTLAHLCAIYYRSKKIPEKPKTVYSKIVRLLLEEWDEQRTVRRESAYASFDVYRKAEFLQNMAYELTSRLKTSSFDRKGLLYCYKLTYQNFGLPESEATKVVDELETHTGLFLQSGQDRFEFSHKSLQEYLTAEFIVRLASIPSNMIELQILPNELAIAVAIASRPSEYLTELVVNNFPKVKLSFQFARSFVSRLLLEDPDFENNEYVGYALLSLYSQYLGAYLNSQDQLSLFVMDQLGTEFTTLAKKIRQRTTLRELTRHFSKVEESHSFLDGEAVWRYQRKTNKQGSFITGPERLLPNELWERESLLSSPEPLLVDTETPIYDGDDTRQISEIFIQDTFDEQLELLEEPGEPEL